MSWTPIANNSTTYTVNASPYSQGWFTSGWFGGGWFLGNWTLGTSTTTTWTVI